MKLKSIAKELNSKGYKTFLRENKSEEWIVAGIDDQVTNLKFDNAFQIRIIDKELSVSYLKGQTPVNDDFTSEKEMFNYLLEKFPVK